MNTWEISYMLGISLMGTKKARFKRTFFRLTKTRYSFNSTCCLQQQLYLRLLFLKSYKKMSKKFDFSSITLFINYLGADYFFKNLQARTQLQALSLIIQ